MPDRTHRHARRRGEPWTPTDDRRVLEADPGTLKALAVQLGRTHYGVTKRRQELRLRTRRAA
jgi:hypothetical protein